LTTPIFSPSAIMKLSISLALLSLSSMYLSIISLNSVANYLVEVCVFHFIAFTLYSLIFSPSNHLHLVLPLHILASEAVCAGVCWGGRGTVGCVDGVGVVAAAGGISWVWCWWVVVGVVIGR
jgi:hypothetical protein